MAHELIATIISMINSNRSVEFDSKLFVAIIFDPRIMVHMMRSETTTKKVQ